MGERRTVSDQVHDLIAEAQAAAGSPGETFSHKAARLAGMLDKLAGDVVRVRAYNSHGPSLAECQPIWRKLEAALAAVKRARALLNGRVPP